MSLKVTILGCGTSGGVPRVGDHWGACDPANPKNRRRRCSLLVERDGAGGETAVLVDTSPDLRQQLLDAGTGWVDGVLYTHDHADHVHGIDDLRHGGVQRAPPRRCLFRRGHRQAAPLALRLLFRVAGRQRLPADPAGAMRSVAGEPVKIGGAGGAIEALPFRQIHGSGETLGFRFGGLAYSPDVSDFPEESLKRLHDLDVWIIDALRPARRIRAISPWSRRLPGSRGSSRSARCSPICMSISITRRSRASCRKASSPPMTAWC